MDILEQADASMCRENVGCKPDVCVCGVMGDMKDEIERLRDELKFADEIRQSALQSLFGAEKEIERLQQWVNELKWLTL